MNWGPPSETPLGLPKRENASFSSLIMRGGGLCVFLREEGKIDGANEIFMSIETGKVSLVIPCGTYCISS